MPKRGESTQYLAAKRLDDLAEFEDFKESILPVLQQALKDGLTAEQIYTKFQAYAAARTVSIVAREVDSGKALAAIREVLDRSAGKAVERTEVTHKMEKLPDAQLDALIRSKLEATEADDAETEEVH